METLRPLRAYHLVSPPLLPSHLLLARVGPGCLRGYLSPTTLLLTSHSHPFTDELQKLLLSKWSFERS